MPRRVIPTQEKDLLKKFYNEGLSYAEIAKLMVQHFPETWGKSINSKNMVSYFIRSFKEEWFGPEKIEEPYNIKQQSLKTLDEMTREERFDYISKKIQKTPRFKLTFKSFAQNEQELFVEEYLNIIKSIDSLTEPEEQSLFASVLELVLGLQALNRKEQEEQFYEKTKTGIFNQGSPQFTPTLVNAEKYAKEYDNHMKLYQKGMEQLNMARHQRVKDVKSDRRSLVDLAQELTSKSARALAAEQIVELSQRRDDELKRMIDNGWLKGIFS